MFRIESYLTPIILNHVAKYVKDFRPQDAQFSLWQGEVVLQNLNMRLDVLEDELQLPFELLSGHIHELSILVPWTKIISEPIKITINTIEFVLKVKNDSDESARSGDTSETRTIRKNEELQQEQGGLVNKIIKNIEVNCHNIIFKLVVEDIVLSMNVQLLSFSSADENWEPAMMDFNPLNVLMRKLVKISDLTICLDKRNQAGQIEVCQEPMLYRCNLECRILDKYNVRTIAKCSTKRIGIFTELLDINISSLQFPMLMRLFNALYSLDTSRKPISNDKNIEVFHDAENDPAVNSSYLAWLWNSLPTFDFELFEEEEVADADLDKGHTRDVGIYIERLNITLKKSEFFTDALMNTTKRLRYTPIVRLSLSGMYYEKTLAEELGWSSVKSGLTTVVIEPMGPFANVDITTNALLDCSSSFHIGSNFIDKSLFDKRCLIADKCWGVTNYKEYYNRITDEYLLYRTPILAFDLVEYKISNEEDNDSIPTDSNSDKRIQYRLLSSGVTLRYNQVFLQIQNIINDYVKSYDYPENRGKDAQNINVNVTKLQSSRIEDFMAYNKNVPLATYRFNVKNINLEIYTYMDPPVQAVGSKTVLERRLPGHVRKTMKYFLVQLEHIEAKLTRPADPAKAVEITCYLLKKDFDAQLEACYNNYTMNATNFLVSLTDADSNSLSKIVNIPIISCQYSSLILPHQWKLKDIPLHTLKVQSEQINLDFTRRELNTIYNMFHCINEYKPNLIWSLAKQEIGKAISKGSMKLHNKFMQLQVLLSRFKAFSIWNISIKSLMTEIVTLTKQNAKRCDLFSTTPNLLNNQDKWLELQVQFPNNDDVATVNKVFALWVGEFVVSIDKHFLEFLNYSEERDRFLQEVPLSSESLAPSLDASSTFITTENLITTSSQTLSYQYFRPSSRKSTVSDRKPRKMSYPAETIHLSSDRDERTSTAETTLHTSRKQLWHSTQPISIERLRFLKESVVQIKISQSELHFGENLAQPPATSDYTKIQIPNIVIESAEADQIVRSNMHHILQFPIPHTKNTFNWTVNISGILMRHHSTLTVDDILLPIETNISVAVMHQTELQKVSTIQNLRKSRTSTASSGHRSSHISRVDEFDDQSESSSEFSSEDDENMPTHQDKGVQLSRSNESISMVLPPSLYNIVSDMSIAAPNMVDSRLSTSRAGSMVSTSIMPLMSTCKKDIISVSLHADTTPIHFLFSVQKIKALICQFELLSAICDSLMPSAFTGTQNTNDLNVEIVTPLEEHEHIKEFLALETKAVLDAGLKSSNTCNLTESFLCQWTITKIIIELVSSNDECSENSSKCVLELEDLLSTVDIRSDYTKYTGKVGNFNLRYMALNPNKEWISNERLRIKTLQSSGNALPFFNVIITSASSNDFHYRIGASRKSINVNQKISEICFSIEALEIIIDFDKFARFIKPLCPLLVYDEHFKQKAFNSSNSLKSTQLLTSANLPMIYLESKGFVLYLPIETGIETCTVLILKIQKIEITPNLPNPLQRTPIRADVFAKASALGFISTPGSILEDRQYELTLTNICLFSGDFKTMLGHMHDRSNFLHTNPAFEWNTHGHAVNNPTSKEIFKNFTFVCIFAPCILYKNVLICGQAIEFNCASKLIVSLNTNEIKLLNCLMFQLYDTSKIINSRSSVNAVLVRKDSSTFRYKRHSLHIDGPSFVSCSSRATKTSESPQRRKSAEKRNILVSEYQSVSGSNIYLLIDETGEQNIAHTSESGFYSCLSSHTNTRLNSGERLRSSATKSADPPNTQRKIPNTVSLIAGEFIIRIFDVVEQHISVPLISFTISEPSFIISQNIYELSTQMTLFDISVNIAAEDGGKGSQQSENMHHESETTTELFPHNLLKTKQGTLSATGIPPTLFSCKTHLSKSLLLEVNVDVSKPLVLILSEEYMEILVKHFILINKVLLEGACGEVRSAKPIIRGTKNKLMRLQFFNADRLHCKLDWLEVKLCNETNDDCSLIFAEALANVKFLSRPEKANCKLSISNVHLKTNDKVVVHPMGLRASADFVTEPWYSLPLISASVRFNVVQIDANVHQLLQLRHALMEYKRISELFLGEWQQYLRSRPIEPEDSSVNHENLVPIKCPLVAIQSSHNKDKAKQREEFYQDDLRAGAFQFVELSTDSVLPLPYQIHIIKKNFGIICWRYPQPRKMSKIQIFPIPINVPNPIHIKCRMEYFCEAYEGFLHFCDFWISETVSKDIEFPERPICANIWRVVIMQSLVSVNGECFETAEEDDELQFITTMKAHVASNKRTDSDPDFILDPKLLVGCMRIDTCFQSESVPKVQLLLSFNILKLNILNHPAADAELPSFLEGYKLAPTTQISQTFLSLNVERMSWSLSIISSMKYSLGVDMTFSIKCIDYGFLNMVYLLEESSLRSYFHVNRENNSVTVDVVQDKIRINFGPSILHTLLSAKKHWEESLTVASDQAKSRHHVFIPKFIIVNQTFSVVSFGQTGSSERNPLQPKEVHMYSFRSHFYKQELTFYINDVDTLLTEASESVPISLKLDGTVLLQNIRIGNKCLIIKSQKLSATQIYVLIKGQIELISMVPHELLIEIRREGKRYNENNTLEYSIEAMSRCSFFRNVQKNTSAFMRLKFTNGAAKGRSGDIPLRANRHLPWLVKVPHRNDNFRSFWVRVLREEIAGFTEEPFQPQRVLITIWPIFEICSMLTCSMGGAESSNSTQADVQEFEVEPRGGRYLLDVPATHLTEHQITFKYNFPVDPIFNTDYVLSLKNIDWNEFFWYDEKVWRIEHALQELPANKSIDWPLNDTEELRITRLSRGAEEASTINYTCTPSRDFSCALSLTVAAWGLFINATGLIISVCDYDRKTRLIVESNGIEMMLAINTAFTLEILVGKTWIASLPIYFKETRSAAKEKFYVAIEDISSEIVILCGDKVVKFVLDFKIEDERKIFILRSKYNIINFTKMDLCVLPFALDHKESSTSTELKRLDSKVHKKTIPSSQDGIGQTLDSFFDLYSHKSMRSSDSAFVTFVCIKLSDNSDELSIPIPLTMQFNRKCFSLRDLIESIPLVVTLIEQNGIFYLSIFDDPSPAILLNNHTDIKLVVAQTNAGENSKVTTTTAEYDGKHFVWNQLVAPFSKCYYTPPEMYVNFPDVESIKCNLALALWKDNISTACINWSKPIRTDKSWEKYLHVPNHGDVKVIICDRHNIIRVSIYYISQQMEFSVKDIRSRLLLPNTPSQQHTTDTSNVNVSSTSITTLLNVVSNTSKTAPKADPSDNCTHFRSRSDLQDTRVNITLRFFVKEINLNLNCDHKDLDYVKSDIFALYIDDCMLAYDSDSTQRQFNVLFANMQVDNQSFSSGNYDFPVVLCSQELYKRSPILPQLYFLDRLYRDLRSSQPMVAVGVDFFDDELKISSLECTVSPIRAYIEDAYLNELLDVLVEFVPSNCVYLPEDEEERLILKPGEMLLPRKIAEQSICMAEPMKLRSFKIQPLNLLLSVHTSVRLYIALDHSPLSFSSYERRQIISVPLRFGQSVGMHYLSGAIFGAGWVVGSLEILGSPSGLARSFKTGLRDFVSMPVRGLLRGPWGFIVGITQGSASLLRNVTAGTVNSMTKLASSVARNLDRLSLDQDHIDRTEALRRLRPQGFTKGISQGVTGLGISLLGAVGGIARHTLEARTAGQVVTGVGKGLVGAVTKPLGGAAELLALTGQGVLQSVGFNTMPQQRTKASGHNVTVALSDYRLWKLLPRISTNDQILFYQEVTVKVQLELKRAYVLLTSEAFAIVEAKSEKLSLALPIEKVEMTIDSDDKTLVTLRISKENDDEEDFSYTNERIMTFIRSSFLSIQTLQTTLKTDSQNELLEKSENETNLDWAFYINQHLGQHLLEYVKIIRRNHS